MKPWMSLRKHVWMIIHEERRRRNKVEDSVMLKAIYLCQQDKLRKWIIDGKEERVEKRACILYTSISFPHLTLPNPLKQIPVVPLLEAEEGMPFCRSWQTYIEASATKMHREFETSFHKSRIASNFFQQETFECVHSFLILNFKISNFF